MYKKGTDLMALKKGCPAQLFKTFWKLSNRLSNWNKIRFVLVRMWHCQISGSESQKKMWWTDFHGLLIVISCTKLSWNHTFRYNLQRNTRNDLCSELPYFPNWKWRNTLWYPAERAIYSKILPLYQHRLWFLSQIWMDINQSWFIKISWWSLSIRNERESSKYMLI